MIVYIQNMSCKLVTELAALFSQASPETCNYEERALKISNIVAEHGAGKSESEICMCIIEAAQIAGSSTQT